MLNIGAATFGMAGVGVGVPLDGVPVGVGVRVGEGVGGSGVGVGVRVGVGVGGGTVEVGLGLGLGVPGVGVGLGVPGVGVGPIVISPLFCWGECEFKSLSMYSKSLGNARQVNGVEAPGVELTRFQWMTKSDPEPFNGVTPLFTKAETRNVLIVPGPVFKMLPLIVHPLPVSPAGPTGPPAGLGSATAESKVRSPWNPMKQVELSAQFPPPSKVGVMVVVMTG
jgi:hypothetical protein